MHTNKFCFVLCGMTSTDNDINGVDAWCYQHIWCSTLNTTSHPKAIYWLKIATFSFFMGSLLKCCHKFSYGKHWMVALADGKKVSELCLLVCTQYVTCNWQNEYLAETLQNDWRMVALNSSTSRRFSTTFTMQSSKTYWQRLPRLVYVTVEQLRVVPTSSGSLIRYPHHYTMPHKISGTGTEKFKKWPTRMNTEPDNDRNYCNERAASSWQII